MATGSSIATQRTARPLLWIIVLAAVSTGASVSSDVTVVDEIRVKAGFVLNFPAFVDWPAASFTTAGDPLRVGIVGDDPLGAVLENAFRGARVHNRSVHVERVERSNEATRYHVVYISQSEERRLDQLVKLLDGQPVLTIGNFNKFADRGGMIHLFVESNRVRFAVNNRAARRSGLSFRTQLLNLAAIVIPG